ncbi:MAG: FHA domain-containing protein [Verrucomicrobiota bacterium]
MLQLRYGTRERQSRETAVAAKFPFTIGSSSDSDLRIEGHGVWDRHVLIELDSVTQRFTCSVVGSALLLINGETNRKAPLRNGDILQLGSASVEVSLAPVPQHRLKFLEFGVWGLLGIVAIIEAVLMVLLA